MDMKIIFGGLKMSTLISADNTWVLWVLIIGSAAISIVLEQKYSWGAKVTGAIIALFFGLGMSNLRIIPTDAPVYDVVWGYVVPISIPMLLFKANIRRIWRESGRMLKAFVFAVIGTSVGAFIATFLLHDYIPELGKIGGMMTASYIGGGVNFVAMTAVFKPSEYLINSAIVADNLVMGGFFFVYIAIPTFTWFRKRFKLSYPNLDTGVLSNEEAENKASSYWSRKEISLKDVALTVAISVAIAGLSSVIGKFTGSVLPRGNFLFDMIHIILSNQYFLITLFTVSFVAIFPKFFDELSGGQEIGTFLIYIFFVVIGIPASIMEIIINSPLLFVYCLIMAVANLIFCLIGSKVTNISLEEAVLAANATVGGPTTAAAMAISKGWNDHIAPGLLCGLAGYVTGNYLGLFVGNLLIRLFG